MIKSFGDSETEKIWKGAFSFMLPNEIQTIGRRKLRRMNNAQNFTDLRIPPSNRLEKLKGKLKGKHSIRINRPWRIAFKWINNNAEFLKTDDGHE